jgi:hypothetical protein
MPCCGSFGSCGGAFVLAAKVLFDNVSRKTYNKTNELTEKERDGMRKGNDPVLELLGYGSEEGLLDADEHLRLSLDGLKKGDGSLVKSLCRPGCDVWDGLPKTLLSTQQGLRFLFGKSDLQIVEVEENSDDTCALVHITGEAVHFDSLDQFSALEVPSHSLLKKRQEKELPLSPVTGVVAMEKENGRWYLTDPSQVALLLLGLDLTK